MASGILIHNLGYPRVGAGRQLKKVLEAYWRNAETEEALEKVASELRRAHWLHQRSSGIDLIPSGDFSFYDHVLDTAAMVGAVPERFDWNGLRTDLSIYFAMARGDVPKSGDGANETHSSVSYAGVHPMEMTKWFDTNYHYIVPEFREGQRFILSSTKVIDEFQEALKLGIKTKPVMLGPVTFLRLGKIQGKEFDRYRLLPALIEVYMEIFRIFAGAGAEWVQLDEPVFALDMTTEERRYLLQTYAQLIESAPGLKFIVASYFNDLGDNLQAFAELPVHGLHVDTTKSEHELAELLTKAGREKIVSLGLVHGRDIWRNNYEHSLAIIRNAVSCLGEERVWIAPSSRCSTSRIH
jgi:5-methyltetrahydropteroyltriglutamate--homocysteine methyltransferase